MFFFNSTLEYLFENAWLDQYTRAIFVEFTVYNANVNLFCIVTVLMETSAGGEDHNPSSIRDHLEHETRQIYLFM